MKKLFSLVLVFVISITLVGCGETTTEEKVIDYIEVNQSMASLNLSTIRCLSPKWLH